VRSTRISAAVRDHGIGVRSFPDAAPMRPAWVLAVVALLAGCAFDKAAPTEGGEAGDTQLAAFEREHPSCQLWTNWQKMCSRTGRGGSTYCVRDDERSVRRSEPFCAHYRDAGAWYEHNARQEASSLRFCRTVGLESLVDGDGRRSTGRRLCKKYGEDRPFNGRRLAARANPLCEEWITRTDGILVCARWRHKSCGPLDVPGGRSAAVQPGGIWFPESMSSDETPVLGVMCSKTER
jgi:hypothetical protein